MIKLCVGVLLGLSIVGVGGFIFSNLLHSESIRDIALYTHITSLCLAVCGIVFADHLGFAWVRGKKQTLESRTLIRTHWFVGIGLGLMVGSGSVLFWNSKDYLLTDPAFYIKMSFVLALIINSFIIEKFMQVATVASYATLTPAQKKPLIISGGMSTVSWLGAGITAFFLFN